MNLNCLVSICCRAKLLLLAALLSVPVLLADSKDKTDVPKNKSTARRDSKSSSAHSRKPLPKRLKATDVREQGKVSANKPKYLAGENPEFAKQCGWPVKCPEPLTGSVLPQKRIVAYYGNPLSKKMGVLGEYPKEEMLRRLKGEVEKWTKADPAHPVQPALHLIAVVAQGQAGPTGKYRMVMPDKSINDVYGWAHEANAILFIDIQTGHDDIRALLPRFEWILKNPDVHLAIDPEFNLTQNGKVPGAKSAHTMPATSTMRPIFFETL